MNRASHPDTLRSIGIVFVVAIHGFAYLQLPTDGYWALPWFLIHQIAVPIFFFADGWIYGYRNRRPQNSDRAKQYLKTSAYRLLVPWLIFSSFYLATRILGEKYHLLGGTPILPNGMRDLPLAIWDGFAAGQLYFLPSLFIVRVVTTITHRYVTGSVAKTGFLAVIIMLAWRIGLEPMFPPVPIGVEPILAAATGMCFAAIGWWLAELEFKENGKFLLPLSLGCLLLTMTVLTEGRLSEMTGQIGYLLALWSTIRYFGDNATSRLAQKLGLVTMEIYLLHGPIVIKLASDITRKLHMMNAIALPSVVIISISASLAGAMAMKSLGLGWTFGIQTKEKTKS